MINRVYTKANFLSNIFSNIFFYIFNNRDIDIYKNNTNLSLIKINSDP
jgi:hypothetical protein